MLQSVEVQVYATQFNPLQSCDAMYAWIKIKYVTHVTIDIIPIQSHSG